MKYTRGNNPNSRKKRVNTINDNFFSDPSLLNCYWAGFIAADGNVSGDLINLSLQDKDEAQVMLFNNTLNSSYKVRRYVAKEKFPYYSLTFTSKQIKEDLFSRFNITEKKSLTLQPPNLIDTSFIDAFIVGYMDGDGSMGLYNSKRQKSLVISVLGTLEICQWIKTRFEQILGKSIKNLCKTHSDSENTYRLYLADKNARLLFQHYYTLEVPKLKRKWSTDILLHCQEYKKFVNTEKHLMIKNMLKTMLPKQVANQLGITQAAVSWYKHKQI